MLKDLNSSLAEGLTHTSWVEIRRKALLKIQFALLYLQPGVNGAEDLSLRKLLLEVPVKF